MKKVPLVLVAFSCSLSLYAQVSKSNLVGIIRDQTGAAVPGATVRLVAQEAEELAVVLEEDAEHFGDGRTGELIALLGGNAPRARVRSLAEHVRIALDTVWPDHGAGLRDPRSPAE
jgi:hypothetical protein